jgi:hypothetical protein
VCIHLICSSFIVNKFDSRKKKKRERNKNGKGPSLLSPGRPSQPLFPLLGRSVVLAHQAIPRLSHSSRALGLLPAQPNRACGPARPWRPSAPPQAQRAAPSRPSQRAPQPRPISVPRPRGPTRAQAAAPAQRALLSAAHQRARGPAVPHASWPNAPAQPTQRTPPSPGPSPRRDARLHAPRRLQPRLSPPTPPTSPPLSPKLPAAFLSPFPRQNADPHLHQCTRRVVQQRRLANSLYPHHASCPTPSSLPASELASPFVAVVSLFPSSLSFSPRLSPFFLVGSVRSVVVRAASDLRGSVVPGRRPCVVHGRCGSA